MPLHIDGPEAGRLSQIIENAFPTMFELQATLASKLNDNIQNHAGFGAQFPEIRFNLIQHYNARYHIDKLVSALFEERPNNALLAGFAVRHNVVPGADAQLVSTAGGLEKMLDPKRGFKPVHMLLTRLGTLVNSICQITVPTPKGEEYGTGFLIGHRWVLTNWHVVENVTSANRNDVKVLFDFRTGDDGKTATGGTPYSLDTEWLVAHSPYHEDDKKADPLPQRLASTRQGDFLDFAVIRLDKEAGRKLVRGKPRGFLRLSEPVDNPAAAAEMFIFQHPYDKGSQKVLPQQWDNSAVLGLNADGTRVLYDVNTAPGSSGSPCLNGRLELIALHHAGAKDWPEETKYLYNQGVPIGLIRKALKPYLEELEKDEVG
jgi:V8-like Glu-specific endopeptidase